MLKFVFVFLLLPYSVYCGCMGHVEDYMTAEMGVDAGIAIANVIPQGYGKTAGAILGIVGEAMKLCKELNKNEETREYRDKSMKILDNTIAIVQAFDIKIEQNFLKVRNAILNINASAQLIHKSVNRYMFTMALLEYDRFQSALENLGNKYHDYIKKLKDEEQLEVAAAVFKRACENLDTSPSRIIMQMKEIVEDEDGIFMIGMRMNNYTDNSFVEYFEDMARSKDLILSARVTYELLGRKDISPETEHTLRETIEAANEEIYLNLKDLNERREKEYFANLTYLFSGYIPRNCYRGYDNYLNRHFVKFRMENYQVSPKYVYSVEYEHEINENKIRRMFDHYYNKKYVSILRPTFQEELTVWRQQLDSLINSADLGNVNDTHFWQLKLREKLFSLVLDHGEIDVTNEQSFVQQELGYADRSYRTSQLTCDLTLTDDDYNKIFPQFEPEFDKQFRLNITRNVNMKVGGAGSIEDTMNNIIKMKQALSDSEKLFYINITYEREIGNISMLNATDMQQETQEKIKTHIRKMITDCINYTATIPGRFKSSLTANLSRIIVDMRYKLKSKIDYREALSSQVAASGSIVQNTNVDGGIKKLQIAIQQIANAPLPYVVRTYIFNREKSAVNMTSGSRDFFAIMETFRAFWNYKNYKLILKEHACNVTGHILIAMHLSYKSFNLRGFGTCYSQWGIRGYLALCYARLAYEEKCQLPVDSIGMDSTTSEILYTELKCPRVELLTLK